MSQTSERERNAPTPAASGFDYRIYAIAAAMSLLLSVWGAWAQFIPNPDAARYLRSAELFADGRWAAAVATYGWPLYSVVIAAVMTLTGFDALIAAQVANALFALIATIAFMGLASRLANREQLVVVCAAIVILLQPQLVQLRPFIIRDNGYFAFLLVSLYLVACDIALPRLAMKIAIATAIVVAGLFRIEGFFLGFLVLVYYLSRLPVNWSRSSVMFAIIAVFLLIILGLLMWTSGTFGQWLTGHFGFDGLKGLWSASSEAIATRLHKLKYDLLYPFGGGNSWGAYIGMVIGIATVNIVRAVTIPLAILTVFAFFPKRLMPRPVTQFVLWFSFGQLPVLLIFTFVAMLLDRRYAVAMALVLDIALVFLLAEMVRQWRPGSVARPFLPVMVVVMLAVWAAAIPRPSNLAYLKEAGEWIGHEVPIDARIITNDSRIAYFSGRPYGEGMRVSAGAFSDIATGLASFNYFAVQAKDANSLPAAIGDYPDKQLVRSFAGKDGDHVLVYKRKEAVAPAGN